MIHWVSDLNQSRKAKIQGALKEVHFFFSSLVFNRGAPIDRLAYENDLIHRSYLPLPTKMWKIKDSPFCNTILQLWPTFLPPFPSLWLLSRFFPIFCHYAFFLPILLPFTAFCPFQSLFTCHVFATCNSFSVTSIPNFATTCPFVATFPQYLAFLCLLCPFLPFFFYHFVPFNLFILQFYNVI